MEDAKKIGSIENLEINLLYIVIMATERIIDDIDKRLKAKKSEFRREKKLRFRQIIDSIKNIKRLNDLIDQEDYAVGLQGNYESYQYYQEDAYELARLLLLFADRSSHDVETGNRVIKYIRSLEGLEVIDEDALKKFYLKK